MPFSILSKANNTTTKKTPRSGQQQKQKKEKKKKKERPTRWTRPWRHYLSVTVRSLYGSMSGRFKAHTEKQQPQNGAADKTIRIKT